MMSDLAFSLEERSFVNFVRFYEPELRMVIEGARAEEVLGSYDRKRLRRWGVLLSKGFGRNITWRISKKAQAVLEDVAW